MTDAARYARSDHVVARRVAGELILVPVDSRSSDVVAKAADLYALNDTGAGLWQALEEPRSAPELARILMTDFDIAHAQATHDVEAFLTDMLQIGAIVRAGDRQ